ncbi:MAG TPA: type IX secretion system membrane protein PorP/SprF [Crocinitomix sp.]|nr:type IX secretion system membrane protein PorP/SprF [Crocinitomix sp.]
MKILHISILTIMICLISTSQAQQSPLYNQSYINPYVYNPSYIGFSPNATVTLIRNQKWTDYNNGFITNYATFGALLKDKKSGIGIDLYSDYVGVTSKLKAHLAYSYRIKLTETMNLRAGVSAGVIDNRINFSEAVVSDNNDPLLNQSPVNRKTNFDLNVGINYTWSNFQFGIAVPQVVGHQLFYDSLKTLAYTLERQFVVNTSYKYFINQDKGMSITPHLLAIYSPNLPLNYNGSFIFEWEKYGWIAATYKSNYAVGVNLGINLVKNLKIGLAYDIQINEVASYNSIPNFEMLLHYTIPQFTKHDTIVQRDTIIKTIEVEKVVEKPTINMDSIMALNARIKELEDSLKNRPKTQVQTETNVKDGVNVKTNADDHFIEILDKSDSPNGYYVVVGAFGDKKRADKLLNFSKKEFPNARLIYNERNNLTYVILFYSTNLNDAKKAYRKSRKLEGGRFYKAWVLDYHRKR